MRASCLVAHAQVAGVLWTPGHEGVTPASLATTGVVRSYGLASLTYLYRCAKVAVTMQRNLEEERRQLAEFEGNPHERTQYPMTPERAIEIIQDGGTLRHRWHEYQAQDGEWVASHRDDCEWCEAVRTLDRLVKRTRQKEAEEDLNRSW